MTDESQVQKEQYFSSMGRELPIKLNEVKKVASGFEVNTDGTIDFVVYGGSKNARQLKEVVNAIENAGYQSEVVVSPKITGLRGVADGTTRQMGIVRAVPEKGTIVSKMGMEVTPNIEDVKPGDIVVVQGIKDTYEGVVVSVQDNTIRMRTPQWATMSWNKSSIKEITPRIARDEYVPSPKVKGGRKARGTAAGGYLK